MGSMLENLKRGVHYKELVAMETAVKEAAELIIDGINTSKEQSGGCGCSGGSGTGTGAVDVDNSSQITVGTTPPKTGLGSLWAVEDADPSEIYYGKEPPTSEAVKFWVDTSEADVDLSTSVTSITIGKRENPNAKAGAVWLESSSGYRTTSVNLDEDSSEASFGHFIVEEN